MTAQTSTQRSEAHRNREKAKVARMREALEEISGIVAATFAGELGGAIALDAIDEIAKAAFAGTYQVS